jgi:hypothetical protein
MDDNSKIEGQDKPQVLEVKDKLTSCINLFRKLPPSKMTQNVNGKISLIIVLRNIQFNI